MALGGLASGFGMGPGVSLPRCGRRDGGGVVVLGLAPPLWGVGGLVLGCVVDAGLVGVCFLVSPLFCLGVPFGLPLWVALFVWGVWGCVWGVFVLAD